MQKMQDAAAKNNLQEAVAGADTQRSAWEALAGFRPQAKQLAESALKTAPPPGTALNAAIVLAYLGDSTRAMRARRSVPPARISVCPQVALSRLDACFVLLGLT